VHFCFMQLTINAQTKISQLLEVDRDLVIKTLVGLNKNFSRLNYPLMRNLLMKRVSIADACKISNTKLADFMSSMKQIGFQVTDDTCVEISMPTLKESTRQPLNYIELDVRPILAQDKDPLKEILTSIKKLEEGQGLKLINTFEPVPLMHLLADKGYSYRVEHLEPNTVITYFNKSAIATEEISGMPLTEPAGDDKQFDLLLAGFFPDHISYLDVRNLEMPKPMLTILERTLHLTGGSALFVYHKKIPVYLLPELEKQGLSYSFKTIGPGDVHMLVYKK
jgi:uncharacterized protein (DUF2249 family)